MTKDRVGRNAAKTLPNNFADALVGSVVFLPGPHTHTPTGGTSSTKRQWKGGSCSVDSNKIKLHRIHCQRRTLFLLSLQFLAIAKTTNHLSNIYSLLFS